jgi:ADP-ribose pyrophosphatase
MNKITPFGKEKIIYHGKIFEIVKKPMNVGTKVIEFEIARRSPGTRIIIYKNKKILITKEFRTELNNYDYRLPGGKVFDTLEEYKRCNKNKILAHAKKAAKKESLEETGLIIKNLELLKIAKSGATIEWDLYYFLVKDFIEHKSGQKLEDGEKISINWYSLDEVKKLCLSGKISEDRTLGVLLTFLEKNK